MNTKRRAHCQLRHDWKERIIRIGDEQTSLQNQFDNFRNEIADIDARLEGIETGDILLSQLVPDADKDMAGKRLYNVGIDANSVTAKNISADGVVIKDGGTVDGVDVSAHTHDGTAIGGPKISYNNLTDKPTIPTKLSQLATDENNQRVSAAEKAEWDSKADGSIFTPAKASEWNRISTHTHDGTTVGGPKIPLSNIVPDADKDWNGKIFSNIGGPLEIVHPSDTPPGNVKHSIIGRGSRPGFIFEQTTEEKLLKFFTGKLGAVLGFSDTASGLTIGTYAWEDRYTSSFPDAIMEIKPDGKIGINKTDPGTSLDVNGTINADGITISGSGTVDGVDISTHTHDGSAIGGPKISYNDLADKPTIPRPPMPFKRSVSINLASQGDYIDVIPGTKYGRTALTLERLQYRSIANILEGTGAFVVIGLIYDDNTVGTAIDRVTVNGDTDWHPPTYYGLNQTYQFTKNYIKGIRIERTPGEGSPITGYVDIIGYLY